MPNVAQKLSKTKTRAARPVAKAQPRKAPPESSAPSSAPAEQAAPSPSQEAEAEPKAQAYLAPQHRNIAHDPAVESVETWITEARRELDALWGALEDCALPEEQRTYTLAGNIETGRRAAFGVLQSLRMAEIGLDLLREMRTREKAARAFGGAL